jgi:hypothetical protein
MTLGAKKGDRYILPAFLFLDAAAVLIFFSLINWARGRSHLLRSTVYGLLITGVIWQAYDLARLHPHALAYVNPITKPFFGDRRLGWGEGFDLAAAYLHEKPDAAALKVASPFPTEFAYNFNGEVMPLNHYDGGNADYVLLYRSLLERGEGAWETAIVREFAGREPEKVIRLNGLDYVWLYSGRPPAQ